ncbi:FliA/WhiG family RNA polymerase sigma factor [Pacificimonas sp. WHA3]|uniref:FliA/WhiG family RNA polymerase sigma factor n=1 Tax=Pacificimonas pallii TaxID=2827236 RepID=A0ABS6SGG7_9SPHN|nr:FliA/WhiG family RNA polymerase sigma factor [Pacificimonas pallii]MBV7257006.1 FliA/WhiG family RNA polymerase sigma factor [Pacificimonas pallii]
MTAQHKRAAAAYGEPGRPTNAELIQQYLPLVRRIAWHLNGSASADLTIDDLMQIGTVALIEAAQSHDPSADDVEDNFPSYAKTRIRGAILDEMRRRATMSRGALRRRRELITVRETLSQRLGRDPTDDETAQYMGMDMSAFLSLCDEVGGIRYDSLDEVYNDHSTVFATDDESPFDMALRGQLRDRLAGEIANLPQREGLVLQLYFVEELNLAEVGDVLGVTPARVSQLKSSALKALRDRLSGD